jgi:hypothetical protein
MISQVTWGVRRPRPGIGGDSHSPNQGWLQLLDERLESQLQGEALSGGVDAALRPLWQSVRGGRASGEVRRTKKPPWGLVVHSQEGEPPSWRLKSLVQCRDLAAAFRHTRSARHKEADCQQGLNQGWDPGNRMSGHVSEKHTI